MRTRPQPLSSRPTADPKETVPRKSSRIRDLRAGSIILLSVAVLVMILAFAAFTIDIGYITLARTQLQGAADAGALAAAMELDPAKDQDAVIATATAAAMEVAALHSAGSVAVALEPANVLFGRRTWNQNAGKFDFLWESTHGNAARPFNVVKVVANKTKVEKMVDGQPQVDDRRLRLFFAPVIGHDKAAIEVAAIATFQPRDLMLVLDYSASMNDDSELSAIGRLGLPAVKNNIQQMWQDLGSPTYGNLGFEPDWVTIPGQPASGAVPHVKVKWRSDKIDVTCTKDLSNVVLEYENGTHQKFEGLSGHTGTFQGTGGDAGRLIVKCWIKSGPNNSGDGPGYGEKFDFFDNDSIKKGLGLTSTPYPYPSGSWDEYIDYARSHKSGMPSYDPYVETAGYRRKFGMATLINHWNKNKPLHSQTPDLWKASQQPITALKDSVDILMDYLAESGSEDRVGLSVYTYPGSAGAKLESALSGDYGLIKSISRQRQAGHYDQYTNIGAGMKSARLEFEASGRSNALKTMVLITDGIANRSSTAASPANFALAEADLAKESQIRIMTISLGTMADTALMQKIADRTGGKHFNVPGGSSVSDYEAQLKQVFEEIAADHSLKLIRE